MSHLEDRIGIEPLDLLLAQREGLVVEAANLYARYGPFGTAEHRRKVALAAAELQVRAELASRDEKATEGKVDAMSRQHPTYLAFLDSMEEGRAEWLVVENTIQGIGDRIMRGQALARAYSSEPR